LDLLTKKISALIRTGRQRLTKKSPPNLHAEEREDIFEIILFSKLYILEVILFFKLYTNYSLYEWWHCLTGSHNLFITYRATELLGAVKLPLITFSLLPLHSTRLHESCIREGDRIWEDADYMEEHDVYGALQQPRDGYFWNAGCEVGCAGDPAYRARYGSTPSARSHQLCRHPKHRLHPDNGGWPHTIWVATWHVPPY
jgi:hypothetical protein